MSRHNPLVYREMRRGPRGLLSQKHVCFSDNGEVPAVRTGEYASNPGETFQAGSRFSRSTLAALHTAKTSPLAPHRSSDNIARTYSEPKARTEEYKPSKPLIHPVIHPVSENGQNDP
jgi:hypothetical protein